MEPQQVETNVDVLLEVQSESVHRSSSVMGFLEHTVCVSPGLRGKRQQGNKDSR